MGEKKQNQLRIAFLGMKCMPALGQGGVEVVVEELSTRMAKMGHQVTCYNRSGKQGGKKGLTTYKGVRIVNVPTIDKRGLAAMSASTVAAIRAAFGPYDVVHFHAEGPCAMLWLPKLMGKRCIATIHGLDHQRAKWGKLASTYIMLGEKCAVRFADEVIVLSKGVQDYFMKTYGRKTRFIPNGVNRTKLREADLIQKKFGLEKDGYILFLARLVPEKGLKYLIQAYRQVQTDKKLVIAGGTSDTDQFVKELKALAAGDDRILFTGFVRGQMLEELYSNAYLYTLPSDLEGMPLSLLEAMSYGNCCLVSDIAECTEVVEDKAMVFLQGNVEDLREKLQTACDREELVQGYKKDATEFICGKYDWDEVAKETARLYNK
ncbi:glycosyltransferase family 4 protein [Drancourtella massiliensis]|uniref:Glycosyltransferase family 4 protein n=1 Tax=Drancourtella massiliensis TaxID=1632013 RepID=A0ABS2EHL5_9FIRM|nr:glycosyltransferase family 4 protein [Drancourtella massiliensis]MBM6744352.1 glycosyltransferase family 4 protein [Drancourtella massiliensis]